MQPQGMKLDKRDQPLLLLFSLCYYESSLMLISPEINRLTAMAITFFIRQNLNCFNFCTFCIFVFYMQSNKNRIMQVFFLPQVQLRIMEAKLCKKPAQMITSLYSLDRFQCNFQSLFSTLIPLSHKHNVAIVSLLPWQRFRQAPFISSTSSDFYSQNILCYIHWAESATFPIFFICNKEVPLREIFLKNCHFVKNIPVPMHLQTLES